ncbi:MAG TPA: histidine phosphatase family protein [Candidatus Eisenbacteria bacterium]|nr:histidine phosphatase family protein [Candidatus Eisenbacteria bacterium]
MNDEPEAGAPRDRGSRIELYFLRHADAGDPYAWEGEDAARPLSGKGRRQAERLGAHLARIGLQVDLILTSPKLRAFETATIVAEAIGTKPEVDDRLGDPLSLELVEAILTGRDPVRSAMLVGHDPDFSELLAELIGIDELPLRKGALARLDAPLPLAAGAATLRSLVPPELFKPTKARPD